MDDRTVTLGAIDAFIATRHKGLAFPDWLERQFEHDIRRRRAQRLRAAIPTIVIIYNLFLIPDWMLVGDMIGDADQNIYYERNSDMELSAQLWAIAAKLGYKDNIIPEPRHTIIDDHLPFVEQGIPSVDMIDFDYAYWHTLEDTADKVSPTSLERVGRTLEVWLEGE